MWMAEAIAIAPVKPEILDIVNLDEYMRFQHDAAKIPEKLMNDDDAVAAIREQRAAQTEAANRLAATQAGVDIAKTGADAMKSAGLTESTAA